MQAWIVNPRRKRRKSTKSRRRAKRAAIRTNPKRTTPRRRRHAASAHRRVRRNPRRRVMRAVRRVSRRRIRRNPRDMFGGVIGHTVMPALAGAGGAIGMDVVMSFLPLPAMLQTGPLNTVVKLAGAIGMGYAASKVFNRRVGEQVAMGAATVVLYGAVRNLLKTAVPSLPGLSGYNALEFYSAGQNAGGINGYSVRAPRVTTMGEYVPA